MVQSEDRGVFHFVMIKPSHYDDDGYVIQWARSWIPSNSLAAINGLAMDCGERRILGDDVDIRFTAYDETNTRIKVKSIVKMIKADGGRGLVGLIGVQSNQFPRAVDIGREFRAAGIPVCIGGFHVSGCLAMLPGVQPDLQEAIDLGISLFAGEAEGRLEALIKDAYRDELKPLYNYMNDLPPLDGAPVPYLPGSRLNRTAGDRTSFDAGRGCPFLCSFCTIINVQGRKSRHRSADDVEHIIRTNLAQGIRSFFISDDNFARNQVWEAIFDRLIKLREVDGLKLRVIIQVDTMCHKIAGFIEKAGRAGVNRVFVGLESINPESLRGARKGQNRITEYRAMFQAWHEVGVTTYAGYILGFPTDTRESIVRDIKIIQRELPIDLLEFFILTPLPGSADHKKLYQDGVAMDPDMNNYDTEHVTTGHAEMSKDEWQEAYRLAWDTYYSTAHVETLMRRAKHRGVKPRKMMNKMLSFYGCFRYERLHPLEGGFIRRKYRRDRRFGMRLENPVLFYSRYAWEMAEKYIRFTGMLMHYRWICHRVERDNKSYTDLALAPIQSDEMDDELDLFTVTSAARTTVDKARRRKASLTDVPASARI